MAQHNQSADGAQRPISELWYAIEMVHGQSDSEVHERVHRLLSSGYDANETWDEDFASRSRSGGCVVVSLPQPSELRRPSPIFGAVASKRPKLIGLLVQFGANIENHNKEGRTALQEAARASDTQMIRVLLENGADMEGRVIDTRQAGCTALHLATLDADVDMVDFLLLCGAHPDALLEAGWTALDMAILDRQELLVARLLEAVGGAQSVLEQASKQYGRGIDIPKNRLRDLARNLLDGGIFGCAGMRTSTSSAEHDVEPMSNYYRLYCFCLSKVARDIRASGSSTGSLRAVASNIIFKLQDVLWEISGQHNQIKWDRPFCNSCEKFQCQDFSTMFEEFQHSLDLAHIRDSAQRGCFLCDLVVNQLEQSPKKEGLYPSSPVHLKILIDYHGQQILARCGESEARLHLTHVDASLNEVVATTPPDDRFGRLNSRSAATMRSWLRDCEENHPQCQLRTAAKLPSRIVDVGDEGCDPCLRLTAGEYEPYAALSYCWGPNAQVRTLASNVAQHTQGIPMSSLSKTIQDAIIITRELGIKYLWVDALCIVQDSIEDFFREKSRSGDIYTFATITIMAEDARSSDEGCLNDRNWRTTSLIPLDLRLPTGTPPYNCGQRTSISQRLMVAPQRGRNDYGSYRRSSALSSRGWPLQEAMLSTRKLHCWQEEFGWTCERRNCSESWPKFAALTFAEVDEHKKNSLDVSLNAWFVDHPRRLRRLIRQPKVMADFRPEFPLSEENPFSEERAYELWEKVITTISERVFTDGGDRLAAINGILGQIAKLLGVDTAAGVLGGDLFWRTTHWEDKYKIGTGRTFKQLPCPSWSWASSPAPVQMMNMRNATIHPEFIHFDVHGDPFSGFNGSASIRCALWRRSSSGAPEIHPDDHGDQWGSYMRTNQQRKRLVYECTLHDNAASSTREGPTLPFNLTETNFDPGEASDDEDVWYMPVLTMPARPPSPRGRRQMFTNPKGDAPYVRVMCLRRISPQDLDFRRTGWAKAYQKNAAEIDVMEQSVDFEHATSVIQLF